MIRQGDIWWIDFGEPAGSEPGYRRPVVVVQADTLNRSRIATVIVVVLTSNRERERIPGNVLIPADSTTGLPAPSIAVATQLQTVERDALEEYVGRVPDTVLERIVEGIITVLGG